MHMYYILYIYIRIYYEHNFQINMPKGSRLHIFHWLGRIAADMLNFLIQSLGLTYLSTAIATKVKTEAATDIPWTKPLICTLYFQKAILKGKWNSQSSERSYMYVLISLKFRRERHEIRCNCFPKRSREQSMFPIIFINIFRALFFQYINNVVYTVVSTFYTLINILHLLTYLNPHNKLGSFIIHLIYIF